jgi:DNA processing protein
LHRDLDSWQRLGAAAGIGPVLFRQLVARFGSPHNVLTASFSELCAEPNINKARAAAIRQAARSVLPRDWPSRLKRLGAGLVTYVDRSYPQRLLTIYDYPALLYVRGEIMASDTWAIAVVGSRRASPYGQRVARNLSAGLVGRGFTLVSGLARGVDTAAHRAALESGGRTLAVLGSGVDVIYPPENRRLADEIAASGAVVSEFPPGTRPEPGFFPRRNRLISGLSLGVVVVEAGQKSGALVTAHIAADQGREVFAVPGDITRAGSRGPHHLIQEGAKLVRDVDDILAELPDRPHRVSAGLPGGPRPGLAPQERELLDLITDDPITLDELVRLTGWGSSRVLAALLSLEMKSHIRQLAGKRFVRE